MTDTPNPAPANENSLLAWFVKGAAVAGTLIWAFILLWFVAALSGPGGGGLAILGPLAVLVAATPVFLIVVLPALLFSFLGGEPGVKVGAGFLVAGLLVVGLFFGASILRMIS